MLDRLTLAVERAWFQAPKLLLLLLPLEWLFAALTACRRLAYRKGWFASGHPGVPVIVVGNLSVSHQISFNSELSQNHHSVYPTSKGNKNEQVLVRVPNRRKTTKDVDTKS